jgi:hypothetical protein
MHQFTLMQGLGSRAPLLEPHPFGVDVEPAKGKCIQATYKTSYGVKSRLDES